MPSTLKLKAPILPGKRVEFTSPELPERGEVDLIVLLPEKASTGPHHEFKDVIEFLDSLPKVTRTSQEWAAFEREFREERESWDS